MNQMKDFNLNQKKILIRMDLNVPIHNGIITSHTRINKSIPTILFALSKNAQIIIASHLGRPQEGKYEKKFSLFPVFKYLEKKLKNVSMCFIKNYLNGIKKNNYSIIFLENVRFNIGEKQNNIELSKKYANLCDIFVMDAFATAHRKESSTFGICQFASKICAGPLLISEIKNLNIILLKPKKPLITIIGGSKVSTKFKLLKSLIKITDFLIVGGGIANTFIAINNNVGKSLYEPNFVQEAKKLLATQKIIMPLDSRVGTSFSNNTQSYVRKLNEIQNHEEIMDIGDQTIKYYQKIISKARTILWNGPVGVFEFSNFSLGTQKIAESIVQSKAFSVAGGGDTLSVIKLFNLKKKISYISTGGGSFLEFIEKGTLPVLSLLNKKKS
ncbi:phosphoglycerate kinase [Buchnera aphidicola]|uniref:Phosphoglycerate kinase n=1 Tax=Buchnera aphidicola subsp. Tuberolachnus salignus TaxID=98804 RepID=A0A160SZ89_BUCTT|nr:phosphoglycerate kinase [Buchnera aphidicola]CUR53266.1 Phosphoglycerate kinase [Buchnera aphidicola (Tuberolachnus salignus)]